MQGREVFYVVKAFCVQDQQDIYKPKHPVHLLYAHILLAVHWAAEQIFSDHS